MSVDDNNENELIILSEDPTDKIYAHSIFAQCILPVRSINNRSYSVTHGNCSLSISAGSYRDPVTNKMVDQDIPSGPKARLLFSYINNYSITNKTAEIDMFENLHRFMVANRVPLGGKNRAVITHEGRNIAAADIGLGFWGETETHRFAENSQFKIAKRVSFWMPKSTDEQQLWEPTLILSDEYMAALDKHTFLLNMEPLVALQNNAYAMDMYMWLSYRTANMKRSVKISYEDLHSVFGQNVRELRHFKKSFLSAIKLAIPYVDTAGVDIETDKNHLILFNKKNTFFNPSANLQIPTKSDVFGELLEIGLKKNRAEKILSSNSEDAIKSALSLTKSKIKDGKVKSPPAYFTKALEEGWDDAIQKKGDSGADNKAILDEEFENSITNESWKKIRKNFIETYGVPIFNAWIKNIQLVEINNEEVVLSINSKLVKDRFESLYRRTIEKLWKKELNEDKFIILKLVKK